LLVKLNWIFCVKHFGHCNRGFVTLTTKQNSRLFHGSDSTPQPAPDFFATEITITDNVGEVIVVVDVVVVGGAALS
jgi:hypothetical protein